jgi:hypothetical protein
MEEFKDYKVELVLDGKTTGLNMYVRSVFIGVTEALVGTLKNVGEPKKIEIRVEKKD